MSLIRGGEGKFVAVLQRVGIEDTAVVDCDSLAVFAERDCRSEYRLSRVRRPCSFTAASRFVSFSKADHACTCRGVEREGIRRAEVFVGVSVILSTPAFFICAFALVNAGGLVDRDAVLNSGNQGNAVEFKIVSFVVLAELDFVADSEGRVAESRRLQRDVTAGNRDVVTHRRARREAGSSKGDCGVGEVEFGRSLGVVSNRGNRIVGIAVVHVARDRCARALVGEDGTARGFAEGVFKVVILCRRQVVGGEFVMNLRAFCIGD